MSTSTRDASEAVVNDEEAPSAAPPKTLPIARVARIAASLDLDPALREEILSANELNEAEWEAIEERSDAELRTALALGDTSPLVEHDGAYLARVEEERGSVTLAEYASILRAAERGASAARLSELEIPLAGELVLVRVFEARLASDGAARAELRGLR